MCVSLDIDNTLIVLSPDMPAEDGILPRGLQRRMVWPLRLGARALVQKLHQQGHQVWIYTSSGRSVVQIKLWLLLYGIQIDGVVNEGIHRRAISNYRFERMPSKYPPAFSIDLHVDDSEGVRMEGREHGFGVVVVAPDDNQWSDKVLAAVGSAANIKNVVAS